MALIATKQKGNVEKALNNFMEMASDEVSSLNDCTMLKYFGFFLSKIVGINNEQIQCKKN